MVAASKLRRAQAAAEAARPYAERMDAVLGNIAAAVAGLRHAPRLLAGTGSDKVHLLRRLHRPSAACAARSIPRSCGSPASTPTALHERRQDVKFFCVGRKGYEQLRRHYAKQIIEMIELRGVRTIGFEQRRRRSREKIIALFEEGEFDVCTLFFSRFKSVIAQIPTAQQIIPPVFEGEKAEARRRAYEYEPEEERHPRRSAAAQRRRADLPRAAGERRLEQGARMSAMDNATRNAGEMIRKQTITYNRTRQAMITKELIEIISGAEAL